jgi:hypothetical protein
VVVTIIAVIEAVEATMKVNAEITMIEKTAEVAPAVVTNHPGGIMIFQKMIMMRQASEAAVETETTEKASEATEEVAKNHMEAPEAERYV